MTTPNLSNSAKRRQRIKEQSKEVANYLSTTPPPELVQQWINEEQGVFAEHIAIQAARWGADQELEACCEWLHWQKLVSHENLIAYLRAARRPKPPSLKEQALQELDLLTADATTHGLGFDASAIRPALELLDD